MTRSGATGAAAGPDRMGFILCLTAALHAAAILGIGFGKELQSQAAPRLEVTLAQHRSENPEEADFLAQADQAGSGTLDEAAMLTRREDSPFRDDTLSDSQLLRMSATRREQVNRRELSAEAESPQRVERQPDNEQRENRRERLGEDSTDQLSREIASLEARLDTQRQAYANRPRVRHLTSMSTRRSEDAEYLHQWRTQVETVGNRNYPEEARRRGIEGELRMLVIVRPDGSIEDARILQSSGHALLDTAALNIVHQSAPFQPFPAEMRRQVDLLEIIRTWRFEQSRLVSTQ